MRVHTALLTLFLVNDMSTTVFYTLSLHDALPIFAPSASIARSSGPRIRWAIRAASAAAPTAPGTPVSWWITPRRSEEHTSELQSRGHLVCRLLLEKKNTALTSIIACST